MSIIYYIEYCGWNKQKNWMYNLHPQMLKGHIGVKLSASVNEEIVKRWPQMQKLENWEGWALCLISTAWFLSREGVSCGVEQWSRSMNRRKILLRNNHHLRQPHSHPVQQQLLLSPFHRLGPWGVERNGTCLWPHVYEGTASLLIIMNHIGNGNLLEIVHITSHE